MLTQHSVALASEKEQIKNGTVSKWGNDYGCGDSELACQASSYFTIGGFLAEGSF